jgi:hypothetical protein
MISAFVITCDDEPAILRATLAAARWVDELIVIDKGRARYSTDTNPRRVFPTTVVDGYIRVNWSPTVEETRAFALGQTKYDWVVCLDADEILSPECEVVFREFTAEGGADVLHVPIRHYLLGRHDERSLSWPEWRPCLFRRGTVEYSSTVHAGTRIVGIQKALEPASKACLTHLSNPDVAAYLEKVNRYTSRPERSGVGVPPSGEMREWAVSVLQNYACRDGWGDDYCDVAALLRGLYDIVDGLKRWEATQPDAHAVYRKIAEAEIKSHARL